MQFNEETVRAAGPPNVILVGDSDAQVPAGWHVYRRVSGEGLIIRARREAVSVVRNRPDYPLGFRPVFPPDVHAWAWVSPVELDMAQEQDIGTRVPSSEHGIAVVRETPEGRFIAAAGVGSHTRNLRGSFDSREVATALAVAEVKRLRAAFAAALVTARGGPELAAEWGVQFSAEVEPEVRYPRPGESAWDASEVARG